MIFIFVTFLIYNIIWFLNYNSYNKYIDDRFEALSISKSSYLDTTSDILYGVKKPDYFCFDGNLYVVSEDNSMSILYWPSFMCKDIAETGLIMQDDINKIKHMIYLDENMNYDYDRNRGYIDDNEVEQLFLNNRNNLEKIFEKSRQRFFN